MIFPEIPRPTWLDGLGQESGLRALWRQRPGRSLHTAPSLPGDGPIRSTCIPNVLDSAEPTFAEYLASRGYQTAGFAANTNYCTYESGLDRGFAHFEDYPLTPLTLLGRTVPGSWILKHLVFGGDFVDRKWIRLQSRDARGINNAFIDWLRERRQDRPFFAFLNYFDAHDPYLPPPEFAGRFGIRPDSPGIISS
jgi:arylsulfatase A-like enzyme